MNNTNATTLETLQILAAQGENYTHAKTPAQAIYNAALRTLAKFDLANDDDVSEINEHDLNTVGTVGIQRSVDKEGEVLWTAELLTTDNTTHSDLSSALKAEAWWDEQWDDRECA